MEGVRYDLNQVLQPLTSTKGRSGEVPNWAYHYFSQMWLFRWICVDKDGNDTYVMLVARNAEDARKIALKFTKDKAVRDKIMTVAPHVITCPTMIIARGEVDERSLGYV